MDFRNKVILITGGAGSIGSAIATTLLSFKPKAVRVLDIHEHSLFQLEQQLAGKDSERMRYILGDIRDPERLRKASQGADIIYHAAAYKHVPLCEYNPLEAIKTNVMGTQNVVDAAIHNRVSKVVFISTDKAAHPTGTLGASKLLGEKIITAANYHRGGPLPIFASVRFGNVTMSNGSVIPKFVRQASIGGPLTVTAPEMTRFLMSMQEAVQLIFRATEMMSGGEVFVFKMKATRIEDLARAIIQEHPGLGTQEKKTIAISYTKPRAGEKMHERLIVADEVGKVVETKDLLILLPVLDAPYQKLVHPLQAKAKKIDPEQYVSQHCLMSAAELKAFIRNNNIFEWPTTISTKIT